MITVHHLRVGRPLFTLWLIEELGLDYNPKIYERNDMGRAPPELKTVHPLGKSPVIEDDEHVIAESGAIALHLIENYDSEVTLQLDYIAQGNRKRGQNKKQFCILI
jgi:glutathione S-transferase